MKAIVLHGSPRKGMNSDTLAGEFLRGLAETGDHEVKHFYINEMGIRPCQGCLHCASSPGHRCAIDDDMSLIYDAYRGADLVVWASPMYWGYITAQMKTVQDRWQDLRRAPHIQAPLRVGREHVQAHSPLLPHRPARGAVQNLRP